MLYTSLYFRIYVTALTLPWVPRKHAQVVAFVAGLRALGVWCRVRSAPRNFIMEKYCLEELLVNRIGSHTSQ